MFTPSVRVPLSAPATLKVEALAVPTRVVPTPLPVTVSLPLVACTVRVRPPVQPEAVMTLSPLPPVSVAALMLASTIVLEPERASWVSVSVRFSLVSAVAASVLAAPEPPSIEPMAMPAPTTNVSTPVPPTRLGTAAKVVVPLPSFTVPALVPATLQVEAVFVPVSVELAPLPVSDVTLL